MGQDNRNHFNRSGKKANKSKRKMNRDVALVVDLEATCWRGHPPVGMHKEIIEIGISGIDYKTKEILFKDTIIVKPKCSEISAFCTELTSIDQALIDKEGVSFEKACEILRDKYKSKGRIWLSFGNYDKNQIEKDCKLHNIDNPFSQHHFDIQTLFSFSNGLKKEFSVKSALEYLDLEFEGVSHRGVDDAYNTAKLLKYIFRDSLV